MFEKGDSVLCDWRMDEDDPLSSRYAAGVVESVSSEGRLDGIIWVALMGDFFFGEVLGFLPDELSLIRIMDYNKCGEDNGEKHMVPAPEGG